MMPPYKIFNLLDMNVNSHLLTYLVGSFGAASGLQRHKLEFKPTQGSVFMSTVSHQNTHISYHLTEAKTRLWAVPIGRFLYSLIFILSGVNHFSSATIDFASGHGVPFANFLVPFSGILALVGGLSVLLGYFARMGAVLLILFLVPVTLTMHNFWTISDPMMHQMQMIQFMKNLSLLGGAILIAFYGSGPKSVDHHQPKKSNL
jgi:putative oxidoreductase